jgi:regulator of RNase E activity RraA
MHRLQAAISKPKSSEIHPEPGFRVRSKITRPNPETLARLRYFPTPDISDLMNRLFTMDPGIKNLVNEERIFAPACTVKVFPGDVICGDANGVVVVPQKFLEELLTRLDTTDKRCMTTSKT